MVKADRSGDVLSLAEMERLLSGGSGGVEI